MYRDNGNTVLRLSDNTYIQRNPDSPEYQAFLQWQAEGNVPDSAPVPDPKDAIRSQIEAIERSTGVVRVVREGLLMFAEREAERQASALTAAGTPTTAAALLAQNTGYVKTKAVDDHIVQLRGMLA